MPFNSSGIFVRINGIDHWDQDRQAGTRIEAGLHDTHDNDLGNALSQCITRTGWSQISANIPWGNKRITQLADPVDAQDAATRHFVETISSWSTAKSITGANLEGRLNFTAPSGVNGIGWTVGDLFWGTRPAVTDQSPPRIVLNDKADATGTDVINIDEAGVIGAPAQLSLATNAYRVGSDWRTPAAGTATLFQMTNAAARLYTNVEDTDTAHDVATMHNWWSTLEDDGNVTMALNKSASGKVVDIYGMMNGKARWLIRMGNEIAESGGNAGSNFVIAAIDDAGTASNPAMTIIRSTRAVQFFGPLTAPGGFHSGDVLAALSGALDRIAALEARIEALEAA